MNDKYEFTLNSPLTDEDWDKITDTEFEKTDRITFLTPPGKTVEFAKVVKGKWINAKCSACGNLAPFWPMASTYYHTNYCPHCGAEMRENADDIP